MTTPGLLELKDYYTRCADSEGFLCGLSPEARKALAAITYTTSYPEGAVLFSEEDAARGAFIVLKGRVKITMNSAEGKTVILRIAKSGDVLGLHAVVSGEPCQATAETLEFCQIAFATREAFMNFLRERPEASLQAARQLGIDYRLACEQVRALGLLHSAPRKLAGFLLDWAASGHPAPDGLHAKLTLTHEEIGQMIGASRETVTRTLAGFRNRHLVTLKGSTLVIPNRTALQHFAEV